MTPSRDAVKELATNIADAMLDEIGSEPTEYWDADEREECLERIESLLREGFAEGHKETWADAMLFHKAEKEHAVEEARATAFREAAEIAETAVQPSNDPQVFHHFIADKLRQKADGGLG